MKQMQVYTSEVRTQKPNVKSNRRSNSSNVVGCLADEGLVKEIRRSKSQTSLIECLITEGLVKIELPCHRRSCTTDSNAEDG